MPFIKLVSDFETSRRCTQMNCLNNEDGICSADWDDVFDSEEGEAPNHCDTYDLDTDLCNICGGHLLDDQESSEYFGRRVYESIRRCSNGCEDSG